MKRTSCKSLLWLGFLLFSLALSGCSDSNGPLTEADCENLRGILPAEVLAAECSDLDEAVIDSEAVTGVAAAGAPLIGWVTMVDSEGTQRGPVQLERNGSFSFDTEGLTPPFYLLAEGTAGFSEFHLHQIAKTNGKANINPITNLIAKTATDGAIAEILPEGMATDDSIAGKSPASVVNAEEVQAAMDEAIEAFQALLQPLLDLFDATIDDYMNNTFVADGTGADQFFDTVEVSVSNNGGLFNIIDKANETVIATADLQLDAVKTASPIDATVAAAVKEVKTDMDEIAPFLSDFLTGLKNAAATWLTAYKDANGDPSLEDAADQTFIDTISQYYVTDSKAFGWNDGRSMESELWEWLEDWEDVLLIEGMSNLAVVKKESDSRYLLSALLLWNGNTEVLNTPIAVIKEDGAWKVTGNGYRIDCEMNGNTERTVWTDGKFDDVSGFDFFPQSFDPQVHHVVVFGPGMPANGLVLDPPQTLGDEMWVNSNDRFVFPNGVELPYLYVPENVNDVSFGDIYTWEIYDSSNNLLQEVPSILEGQLIDLDAKTAAEKDTLFPSVDNIDVQSMDWLASNVFGGEYTFEFTPSEAFESYDTWLDLGWWDHDISFWNEVEFNADLETQTATATMGPAPANFGYARLTIGDWTSTYGDVETTYEFDVDSQGNYEPAEVAGFNDALMGRISTAYVVASDNWSQTEYTFSGANGSYQYVYQNSRNDGFGDIYLTEPPQTVSVTLQPDGTLWAETGVVWTLLEDNGSSLVIQTQLQPYTPGVFTLYLDTPPAAWKPLPDNFSAEWLNSKTLYAVWYGNDQVPVVAKQEYADGEVTMTGLMNYANNVVPYAVSSGGLLSFDGASDGANIYCKNKDYLLADYFVNGVQDNTYAFYFVEATAMDFANTLTQEISPTNCLQGL